MIVQLVIIALVSIAMFILENTIIAGVSAVYGGLISLSNTVLINLLVQVQTRHNGPKASVGMMAISVIIRMFLLVILVLIGLALLGLNANALIVGLAFGLIGFLMDKILQK